MEQCIEYVKRKALGYLNITSSKIDTLSHRAHVCVVGDCFVIEQICHLNEKHLKVHRDRLSVQYYADYYSAKLILELTKQYHVSGFPGMLLSNSYGKKRKDV